MEDSAILRGCISIFNFDDSFGSRAAQFLKIFEEDVVSKEFLNRSNLLLCFGDYSQDDGDLTNLLSARQRDWRTFFTTPGYNKTHLLDKTKLVLENCLDFFSRNTSTSYDLKIRDTLRSYESGPKDWKYYFLKYEGFRNRCNQGYYSWNWASDYLVFKMKERQFNGYHWDPFLEAIKMKTPNQMIDFNNYGGNLELTIGSNLIGIKSTNNGFQLLSRNEATIPNTIIENLVAQGVISGSGELIVAQDGDGFDLEDRVEKGADLLNHLVKFNSHS